MRNEGRKTRRSERPLSYVLIFVPFVGMAVPSMAQRESSYAPAPRDPALRVAQSLAFLVGVALCFALSLGFAAGALRRPGTATSIPAGERINPNEAPVPSLMRLPQIGAARARAIVAHRQRVGSRAGRRLVFETADDLRRIKGIGPAIVEDVRPWLRFDDLPDDANQSSAR